MIEGFNIFLTKRKCKFLDPKTGKCLDYENRHEININCLTIEKMIITGNIPRQCLYVVDNPAYQNRKDIRIYHIPANLSEKGKREFSEINIPLQDEDNYHYIIKRSFICPECKSPKLKEEYFEADNDESSVIRWFSYLCERCGHKWDNESTIIEKLKWIGSRSIL